MPYKFLIQKATGERYYVAKPTLAEALRSRHAYKKSPHFRGQKAKIGKIFFDPLPQLTFSDIVNIKKVNKHARP
ncbi:MAG: hypothetical protein QW530_00910 [Candidatus Micrarchaeaceae archaeon]